MSHVDVISDLSLSPKYFHFHCAFFLQLNKSFSSWSDVKRLTMKDYSSARE